MVWAVPNEDAVTLGEIDGELYSVTPRDEFHIGDAFIRRGGAVFPPARVTGLKQRRPFGQEASLTEPQDQYEDDWDQQEPRAIQLLKRYARALGMFFVEDEDKIARSVTDTVARVVRSALIGSSTEDANNHQNETGSGGLSASPGANITGGRQEEKISATAWHPRLTLLAVAQRDGVVAFYDLTSGNWDGRILEHGAQQQITDISWAPYSGGMIAVACRGGIFLWKLACKTKQQEPELLDILTHPSKTSFSQVNWNEDGSLLAAFTADSDTIHIYDIAFSRHTELKCRLIVKSIAWSPTGEYLFVTTRSGVSLMWEACTWKKEIWDVATSSCGWSSNGRCLLVAHQNTSLIYPYEFRSTPPLINVGINTPRFELVEKQVFSLDKSTFEYVGGTVHSLTWDPTDSRVAVTYVPSASKNGDVGPLVIIYSVSWTPFLIFTQSGLVRGPPRSGLPRHLSFASTFEEGALLSVAWSSGVVSFHPFYLQES